MQDVLALVLGGGRGTRLYPLTLHRSEPAVPLAGKYRLIDVPISNCINSGIARVYVLTQFLSVSLHRHIAATYKTDAFSQGFVEVLAAQQTNETADWYRGTADALRQNLRYIEQAAAPDILVVSGDQLYRMDFRDLLRTHRRTRADATMSVTPVSGDRAGNVGLVRLDGNQRIVELVEKPQTEAARQPLRAPAEWLKRWGAASGREYLANMGIYVFRREALLDLLSRGPATTDIVRDVLSPFLASHRVQAHVFDGYWDDLGTIKSYHAAHMALTGDNPPFNFHSPDGIIFTRMRNLPASHVRAAHVERCLISDGCDVLPGARLQGAFIGNRSRIGTDAVLRDTVMIGADRIETPAEREGNRRNGVPDIGVGEGSVIEQAILDKDCRIGKGVRIVNRDGLENHDGENYAIRDSIVVLPNGAVVPDGTVI